MKIKFSKYHGTGNDFILIDNRENKIILSQEQISFLCHRQYGIGADGILFLSDAPGYSFRMKYYNADGNEGTMCGNGGRCIAAFAGSLELIDTKAEFSAIDGLHVAEIISSNGNESFVSLKMSDVDEIIHLEDGFFVNTGSPHFVKLVEDIEKIDVLNEGKGIRWEKRFQPEGTNVNFVEVRNEILVVRSFERGVENITLSCGTGVTASALVVSLMNADKKPFFNIKTQGGDLRVRFTKSNDKFINIWLEGPAVKVFEGYIEI
jgi:diaminopimelate epimerase